VIAAVGHTRILWYLTRGSGLVSLVLLTGSVVLGIVQVKRWSTDRWPRFITAALHKNISLLAVVFLGIHIATTVLDGFAPIGWLDAVIPFRSPYRPLWLGLGAVAVDLLLALVVTSLLRGRIGYRTWRAIHWAAYACWPVAVLHGMGTGTDTRLGLVLALNLVCLAAVVLAVWWRLAGAWTDRVVQSGAAVTAAVASVAVPAAIVGFLLAGPLKPGWSRRAGTPASVTSGATTAAAASTPPSGGAGQAAATPGTAVRAAGRAAAFAGRWADALSGTLTQAPDGTSVTIDGTLTGAAPGHLRVVIQGQPASGGGIAMRASSVSLGPAGQPNLYQGSVSGLSGSQMELAVAQQGGARLGVLVQLNLSGSTTVTGSVTGGIGLGSGGGGD
jgi:methionine sulfoxide reductase heme-binding subunit